MSVDKQCHRPYTKLMAAVIPSAGGKTTLASKELDYLDIDKLLDLEDKEVAEALSLHAKALEEPSLWPEGNQKLWNYQSRLLSLTDCSHLRVVLLHSHEQAQALGFEQIHIFLPSRALHASAMSGRTGHAQQIARLNRETIALEAISSGCSSKGYQSFSELALSLRALISSRW